MRIAIIGTGIAGNVAAYRLYEAGHDIVVFEANDHIGGHTDTHCIEIDGEVQHVDTGFIVFNDWTYPRFVALLKELDVQWRSTSMSFAVRNESTGLEYNGASIDSLFAQRRNLLRPSFLRMLADILRFNARAPRLLEQANAAMTLREFLEAGCFGPRFIADYLVPMGAAIWSTDPDRMLRFPAHFFVRFMHNHGLLSIHHQPIWHVIEGGSARYLDRLVAPWRNRIRLNSAVELVRRLPDAVQVFVRGQAPERFDHVFLACHADQALRMLADPSVQEREILGALPYQRNDVVLHTDTSVLPRNRKCWAAWNYHVDEPLRTHRPARVALTYNMNILQGLSSRHTFCVTLNASHRIDPRKVIKRLRYEHPLFTPAGIAAQQRHEEISGVRRTHYCGAYWRYGFHEDGVVSALAALRRFDESHDAQRHLYRVG